MPSWFEEILIADEIAAHAGSPSSPGHLPSTITTGIISDAQLTQGSIPFVGAADLLTEDNDGLFWQQAGVRMGIGTATPQAGTKLHILSSAGFGILLDTGTIQGQLNIGVAAIGMQIYTKSAHGLRLGSNNTPGRIVITSAGQIGVHNTSPAASGCLDIVGDQTIGTLIIPRMSTTARDLLTAVNGMILYNSSTGVFQGYQSGAWADL